MVLIGLLELSDALRRRLRPDTGKRGEDLAQRFLQRAGFVVVGRNYRMPTGAGEIDLIGWDGDTLVFVEVKTRQSDEYGTPERAIGMEKRRSMVRAGRDYARRADVAWGKVRFDVIAVLLKAPPAIRHFRDVLPLRDPMPAL